MQNSFKDKVLQAEKLEDKINELKEKFDIIKGELERSNNCLLFLQCKSFSIDPNLINYVGTKKDVYNKIQNLLYNAEKLFSNFNLQIGNFRNIVFCLAKEEDITLEELALKLNCSNKDVFSILCKQGHINKENYLKLCNHFSLNAKCRRYWRYCNELLVGVQ